MSPGEQKTLHLLESMPYHRVTNRSMARMAVRYSATGLPYVRPEVIAAWERQGYDPEPFVRHLLEIAARDDSEHDS
jgi:hypothetical protein